LRSELYGDVPSDRFTVHWDLVSAETHRRIEDVRTGRYQGPNPDQVRILPIVTPDNASAVAAAVPAAVRYRIPADIDDLMKDDEQRANAWRAEMRSALSPFITVKSARVNATGVDSPISVGIEVRPGAYDVVAFASDSSPSGERENWYILRRRGGER
jgi:hypothetical protein